MKNCTQLWRDFEIKTHKPLLFWQLRCSKSARRCGTKHISKSKFSKTAKCSKLFWKLRCAKSARRCGAKHISKSKFSKTATCPELFWKLRCGTKHASKSKWSKHHMFGQLLDVQPQYTTLHYPIFDATLLYVTPRYATHNYTTSTTTTTTTLQLHPAKQKQLKDRITPHVNFFQ